ncbi:hypothetical protein D9Q98_009670 [Chlorella vulgaris]|uniref:SBP-type domain-containing protein n=1 Tax=Chlorella vulgaris TaxID=3077 RepID=A0A9D4TER2_CHLVU|nr:hypothetical protein D9Q98_009670 [Chlorella vulgaris]
MPTTGAHPTAAMPGSADGMTWSEADYHWDPVKMIATARKPAGAITGETGGRSDQTALPIACSAAGSVPPAFLASLTHKATPGTSSGEASPCAEMGGCAASPPAAAAAKAAPARGKGRAAGRGKKGSGSAAVVCQCQADGCTADLTTHTYYHQRNKICVVHIKADVFVRGGEELRFCQRCGHAHPLPEFDPGKHSCRKQLEKHNARRRKRQQELAGAQQSSEGEDAPAAAASAAAARGPARRRQPAKRSRVKEEAEDVPEGLPGRRSQAAAAPAAASPSADAVGAFAAAWGACLPSSSLPSAGMQDESGSAGEASPIRASPVSASLQQQLEQQQQARAAGGQPLATAGQLPGHSGPPSLGPDTSASGSAVATTMAQAAPAAAPAVMLAQRPASPALLPVLDFDFDLKPTPFEDLLRQPLVPLDADEELLADDLAAWLNRNLAEDEQRDATAAPQHQHAQQQHPGWQHGPSTTLPPASASWGAEQLQLQQQPASLQLATSIMRQQVFDPLDALLPLQQQPPDAHHLARYAGASSQQPATMQRQAYGAPAMPAAAAQRASQAPASPTLATVSVKLFGCTPEELPLGLRDHLRGWFDGSVHGMDGYLRPGCVHLTVQALLSGYAAERLTQADPPPGSAAEGQAVAGAGTSSGAAAAGEEAKAASGAKSCCAQRPVAACVAGAGQAAGGANVSPAGTDIVPGMPPPPPAAAAPGAHQGPSAGTCCGRKRAAEGPAEPGVGGGDSAVRRVVDRMLQSGEVLWRSKTMLVQAGSHVALVHQGRLRQTWDIESSSARAVPAILEVSPPLLLASQPGELCVSGINMLQNDCRLLLRLQGRYVQPAAATCRDCTCSAPVHPGSGVSTAGQVAAAIDAASFEQRCCGCCVNKLQLAGLLPPAADPPSKPQAAQAAADAPTQPADEPSCCRQAAADAGAAPAVAAGGRRVMAGAARLQTVRLHLPTSEQQDLQLEPLLPGLLHLDIQRRAYSAPRGARVLVVSSPTVHRELLQLIERHGAAALPPQVLEQLGVVHEWLGRPEKMQYPVVEAVAARLLYWAVGCGLPATSDLLLSVLQAQGGSSSAAAAAVLQRAMDAEAAGGAATAAALSSMDGLQHLHLSMQATIAAAVQRAGELACRHGISLLHRAVQSGCGATLRTVLGWGEDAGGSWRCDLQGPQGITPLHLAALLPDPAAARHTVLLLLGRCAPGAQAWDCSCTADGQTPAHFFKAAAAARCGGAAEAAVAALETEIAVLRQLQQPKLPVRAAPAGTLVRSPAPLASLAIAQPAAQAAGKAAGETPVAAQEASLSPRGSGRSAGEMQPATPRKNPGCLCAPGCPCALLDRCACCGDDSEEDEAGGTCGGGSGKCCCCSDVSSHVAGCAGCSAAADGGTGDCCGGGIAAAAPMLPSCCGGNK